MLELIPQFPQKTFLSLNHKSILDHINKENNYNGSALNFTNLFSLDTNNDTYISQIGDGYIIQQQPIGSDVSINLLISNFDHLKKIRSLLPKLIVIDMYPNFIDGAIEDRNNADYIYLIPQTLELKGKDYSSLRRKLNQFIKTDDLIFKSVKKSELDGLWSFSQKILDEAKRKTPQQVESLGIEQSAIEKLLFFQDQLNIQTDGLWVDHQFAGFVITEVAPKHTLLIHIFRCNNDIPGVSEFLFTQLCRKYQATCNLINFEQDLGLPGLKQFKLSLKPIEIKMVYTVKL